MQKESQEGRRQLENLQQLKQQGEEVKKILKGFEEKLSNVENSLGALPTQTNVIRRITNSLEETVNLGSYDNWSFYENKLYLIPLSKMRRILTELGHLEVTVKTQREEGMALVKHLMSITEIITVAKNSRFPGGDYYYCVRSDLWKNGVSNLQLLYRDLEKFDDDCVDIDYAHSKSVIFPNCMDIIEDKGWDKAYNVYRKFPVTPPERRLEKYLGLLCCMINIERTKNVFYWDDVYNLTTFEEEFELAWKQIDQ